jgi:3-dehydroquinate synthase
VLVDVEVLQSLPEREWAGGLAEVVKHGLIADEALFEYLERHWQQILARESDVVRTVVAKAAAVKTDVVRRDEREEGLRAILNFGHTFGHAIERVFGYGTYTHGEAVAAGMRAALHLSRALRHDFPFERADHLVARIPVPSGLARADVRVLVEATLSDKKVRRGSVRYVLLERIGKAYVAEGVDPGLVEDAWHHAQAVVG